MRILYIHSFVVKHYCCSDIESKMNYIAVLDYVILAFQAPFAGFLGAVFTVKLDKIVV